MSFKMDFNALSTAYHKRLGEIGIVGQMADALVEQLAAAWNDVVLDTPPPAPAPLWFVEDSEPLDGFSLILCEDGRLDGLDLSVYERLLYTSGEGVWIHRERGVTALISPSGETCALTLFGDNGEQALLGFYDTADRAASRFWVWLVLDQDTNTTRRLLGR